MEEKYTDEIAEGEGHEHLRNGFVDRMGVRQEALLMQRDRDHTVS